MATKKKAKKTAKTKTPVKNKTAKKAVAKKAVKKKTTAKNVKKASKPAAKKPKAIKVPTKKKTTKKTSATKKTKVAPKKVTQKKVSPIKAIPRKKPLPVKKAETATVVKKTKSKLRALPKLGPETLKIKERLLAKRSDLVKLIQSSKSLERDAGDLSFSNEIDLASSLEGREMLFQLTSRDRNELRLIEDALFRINEGTFGACESCEEQISLKRLQIMPLTPLCISCQETAENL
ncbi:MAG: DnaK suppressor protein [Nitrospinales bacterium]|jgi:DnaK suppressor protein